MTDRIVVVRPEAEKVTIAAAGARGPAGAGGPAGPPGPKGDPGEITQAQLDTAISDKVAHDGTPTVGDLLRVTGVGPLVVGRTDDPAGGGVTRPMQTGYVYLPETGNSAVQNTSIGGTNGYSYAIPIWLPGITIATIGVYVTTAAGATTYDARLGIYRSNAGGIPDTLLVDAGTVSLLTAGAKSAAVNTAVTAGLYWLTFAIQNVTGFSSGPQVSGLQQTNYQEIPVANFGSIRFGRGFIYSPDLTGPLPATYPFVIDSFGQNTPLIGVGV